VKGLPKGSPKLLKNMVAWDRIELPTREFSALKIESNDFT